MRFISSLLSLLGYFSVSHEGSNADMDSRRDNVGGGSTTVAGNARSNSRRNTGQARAGNIGAEVRKLTWEPCISFS